MFTSVWGVWRLPPGVDKPPLAGPKYWEEEEEAWLGLGRKDEQADGHEDGHCYPHRPKCGCVLNQDRTASWCSECCRKTKKTQTIKHFIMIWTYMIVRNIGFECRPVGPMLGLSVTF